LDFEQGEQIAIIGENGAGKTTLAKHLNGLLHPTKGNVLVGEWDTREHTVAQLARKVGYVFQNPNDQLFARSVLAEVAFGPRNIGISPSELTIRVENALSRVGLEQEAEIHPYDLHASQRKFVTIAATLAMDTPMIILDEPTTGQDARGVEQISRIVESLKVEERTVIAISHDLDFCAEHFDRIIVMSEGSVLADGDAENVFANKELLRRAGVEAPQMVRLAIAIDLPAIPRTVQSFVDAWNTKEVGG
jgi:energy-coupling factor transport system ATP-binding protein